MEFLPVTPILEQTLVCHYGTELVGTLSRQNVSASFFSCRSHLGYFAGPLCEPMTIRFTRFDQQVAARWRKLVLVAGLAGALTAIVVAAIWASYGLRFSPFAQSEPAIEFGTCAGRYA